MELQSTKIRLYDRRLARRLSVTIFLVFAACTLAVLGTYYLFDKKFSFNEWANSEQSYFAVADAILQRELTDTAQDILVLANKYALFNADEQSREALTQEFVRYAKFKEVFYQIRLIDLKGNEVVRVNYDHGKTEVVPKDQLQNKSNRDYFKQGLAVGVGNIFVSPFDLNVEHEQIERPLRPVLRIATPVMDERGTAQGLLIINLMMQKFLNDLERLRSTLQGDLMLLNPSGYWLLGHEDSDAWGWLLGSDANFSKRYPEPWSVIQRAGQGKFIIDDLEGVYRKIALNEGVANLYFGVGKNTRNKMIFKEDHLYLVSMNQRSITSYIFNEHIEFSLMVIVLLILAVPGTYFLGIFLAENIFRRGRVREYSKIIESSDDLACIVGLNGKILYVNPAFESVTGYRADEVVGKSPSILKSGKHPDEFYRLLWETVLSGKVFEGIFVNRKKDGSTVYISSRVFPIFDDDGNAQCYVSIGHDLSSIYESYQREMEIVSLMSKTVPHHFNNLLHSVMGYIQLSIIDIENEKIKSFLKSSLDAAVRAEGLISKISMMSHEAQLRLISTDVNELVDECAAVLQKKLPLNIKLKVELFADMMPMGANRDLMNNAIELLLNNAVEALPHGGEVVIKTHMMHAQGIVCSNCGQMIYGDRVCITISDNGVGFSELALKKAFDPFFTTKDSAKRVAETPGLGLTIVRGIVHIQGGHLKLVSEEGKGASITLYFPVFDEVVESDIF